MNGVLAALRRQPVRAYLYGLLGPGLTVAGAYGLVSEHRAALWIALGGAVLLPAGVEAARARVTPVSDPHDNTGRPLGPVVDVPKAQPVMRADPGSTRAPDGTLLAQGGLIHHDPPRRQLPHDPTVFGGGYPPT